MKNFQVNMFFYMYVALLCLESQKIKAFQQKYTGMFMLKRKKNAHGFPLQPCVSS